MNKCSKQKLNTFGKVLLFTWWVKRLHTMVMSVVDGGAGVSFSHLLAL